MAEIDNKPQEQTAPSGSPAGKPAAVSAVSPAGNANQPQPRPCPKDCTKCNFQQHAFCAAKMSFDAFTVMSSMLQKLDAQATVIADMTVRLKAIESAEAELAAPAPIQGNLFPPNE